MALVVLSVVEQRLDAVRAVLGGATVVEVAGTCGVSRQSVHAWVGRYLVEGVAGLADRSHRPRSCPHRASASVEVRVGEMRRLHPRWGAHRIRLELLREQPVRPLPAGVPVPSVRTIVRILVRRGQLVPRPRKKPKSAFKRFERPAPMQLWQVDIVGGVWLVDAATGVLREAKVVTGVDDHSRYCVMARVVSRATARAVCLGFALALEQFGVPEQVVTDNGKQFTNRFGRGGEVLFERICRNNGIAHTPTQPASPNQNGKVERFHGTLRREFLDDAGPFTSLEQAQAAVDEYVAQYNTDRPHQALGEQSPVVPADRFAPVPSAERELVALWLPPALVPDPAPPAQLPPGPTAGEPLSPRQGWAGGAIEFDRTVPPSGNLAVAGKQFWLGTRRAGMVVRFWADADVIHLLISGARIKTVRSHLSEGDLRRLVAQGAVSSSSPAPLPPVEDGQAIEVDRIVSRSGSVSLAGQLVLAAEILAGRRVSIRLESGTLMFFDPATRELLRTRANPLTREQSAGLRGARRAGPPPRPSAEPIRVQRRVSSAGVVMVAGQIIALGSAHAHHSVTILVSETTMTVHLDEEDIRVVRRTTTKPVRSIKGHRPRTGTTNS